MPFQVPASVPGVCHFVRHEPILSGSIWRLAPLTRV